MQRQLREHLLPELRQVIVHDRGLDQAGIDHLEDVIVLEVLGRRLDDGQRLAGGLQAAVEGDQAVVIAAGGADEDLSAGQVVSGVDGRRRPGR